MTRYKDMDDLFERLLPSASTEQIEAARRRSLGRVRAEATAVAVTLPLNHGDYHVLLALSQGDRHGYGIMRDVEQITAGATKFGPGTLHTCIDRLLNSGWIQESHNRPDLRINEEPRQYYRLSGVGAKVLTAESARIAEQYAETSEEEIARAI